MRGGATLRLHLPAPASRANDTSSGIAAVPAALGVARRFVVAGGPPRQIAGEPLFLRRLARTLAAGRRTGARLRARLRHRIRQRLDPDIFRRAAADVAGELCARRLRHFEPGFVVENPDRADIGLGKAAGAADHRQQPFRIGVFRAAYVEAEPYALVAGAECVRLAEAARLALRPLMRRLAARQWRALARLTRLGLGGGVGDFLQRRQAGTVEAGGGGGGGPAR